MQAAAQGDLEAVQWLVKHGANVEQVDENGQSVLQVATYGNHSGVVKYLVNNGADVNKNSSWNGDFVPLSIACYGGYKDLVKYLVNNGADVNKASPSSWRFFDGITPLICACLQGYTDIVEFLIRNEADVNTPMNDGETPLFVAAKKGDIDIVKLLVESGADVDQKVTSLTWFNPTINDKTPRAAAREAGHKDVVEWLEEYEKERVAAVHDVLDVHGLPDELHDMILNKITLG
jgi:ankyrin repeat protein